MVQPLLHRLEQVVVGGVCEVLRLEYGWCFSFGRPDEGGCVMNVSTLWRILVDGRLALTSDDDGHVYGLPQPIDAEARALALLGGRTVTSFHCDEQTADLHLTFGADLRLECLTGSSGYESWVADFRLSSNEAEPITLVGSAAGIRASAISRPG